MNLEPARALASILRPAYAPCAAFHGVCKGIARWDPKGGHVPRGFIGALGQIEEIEVIILVAEPGDPYSRETYSSSQEWLNQVCKHTFLQLLNGTDKYHRRLRELLGHLFPNESLESQLKKVWITETYLCSAPRESGSVPATSENECASRYLVQQLEMFDGRPIVALGNKAYDRVKRAVPHVQNVIKALHPSARQSLQDFSSSYRGAASQADEILKSGGAGPNGSVARKESRSSTSTCTSRVESGSAPELSDDKLLALAHHLNYTEIIRNADFGWQLRALEIAHCKPATHEEALRRAERLTGLLGVGAKHTTTPKLHYAKKTGGVRANFKGPYHPDQFGERTKLGAEYTLRCQNHGDDYESCTEDCRIGVKLNGVWAYLAI